MDPVDDALQQAIGAQSGESGLRYCPSCGSKVDPSWKHCARCGNALPVLDAGETGASQPPSERDRLRNELWQAALGLMRQSKLDEAETAVGKFLDNFPNNADGHALAAAILVKLYRMDDARVHLDRAQQIDPSSAYVHISSAQYWLALGMFSEALEDLEKADAASADDPMLHNNLHMSIRQLREKAKGAYTRPTSKPVDGWFARLIRRRKS